MRLGAYSRSVRIECRSKAYSGHIDDAINMPWDSGVLQTNHGDLLPEKILVYSNFGNGDETRGIKAVKFLSLNGHDEMYNLWLGFKGWINIALYCPVFVSSVYDCSCQQWNANDSFFDTEWKSQLNSEPEWLYYDFQDSYEIEKIILYWDVDYAKKYRIETSTDGATWTTIHTNNNSPGGVEEIAFPGLNTQYMRLYCIERSNQSSTAGFGLWEFEVILKL